MVKNRFSTKAILLCFALIAVNNTLIAQNVITHDIVNFWKAYDALASSQDSAQTFQELYLNQGSRGLRDFTNVRNIQAGDYVNSIKKYPAFWTSIRSRTLNALVVKSNIDSALTKFEREYPAFKYPDVYFLMGKLSSAGTTGQRQILIGSEIALSDSTTAKHELEAWLQPIFNSSKNTVGLVIHEAVHIQQKNSLAFIFQYAIKRKVYAGCIREGAADFVSDKITHTVSQSSLYQYGNDHFDELKSEFSKSMNSKSVSEWLYNYATVKNKPADLGYFMGYKICEAYYEKAENKEKALRKILQTRNPKKILRKSGLF